MVAVNKAWKKYETKGDANGLLALGFTEANIERMKQNLSGPNVWDRKPHASYETTNLRARIRADKDRIKQITARQTRQAEAENAGGVVIKIIGETYAQVTFAEKPDRVILDALKANGFQWSSGYWFGSKAKIPQSVLDMAGPIPPTEEKVPQSVQESQSGCASCLWRGIECKAGSLYQPKSETDEACSKWMYYD